MRAVEFEEYGGPEVLGVVEAETPEPGPGQVSIPVTAEFALADASEAHRLMDSRTSTGKLLLRVEA